MRIPCIAAVLIVLTGCAGIGRVRAVSDSVLEEQLTTLEKQSWVAWQNRDGQFFDSFLADDHVEIGFGGPADKKAIVGFVGSPACVVESYSVNSFHMTRVTPDTAVLVYHAQQKTSCGGVLVPSPVWVSSLYVNRGGRWLNAAYQQSPAAK